MSAPPFAATAPMRLYQPQLCPLTNGNETRISAAGKEKICRRYRGERVRCETCADGNLPPELQIIDITQEDPMGVRKVEFKACELCGELKNTKTNHGKMVCCNCEPVWRMVNNQPEKVSDMLTEKMGMSWRLQGLPAGGEMAEEKGEATAAAQIEELRQQIVVAEAARDTLFHQLTCSREDLTIAYERIQEMQGELTAANEKIEGLEAEFDAQVKINNEAEQEISRLLPGRLLPSRDTAVLDIALKVISGEVQGINAATLAALR